MKTTATPADHEAARRAAYALAEHEPVVGIGSPAGTMPDWPPETPLATPETVDERVRFGELYAEAADACTREAVEKMLAAASRLREAEAKAERWRAYVAAVRAMRAGR